MPGEREQPGPTEPEPQLSRRRRQQPRVIAVSISEVREEPTHSEDVSMARAQPEEVTEALVRPAAPDEPTAIIPYRRREVLSMRRFLLYAVIAGLLILTSSALLVLLTTGQAYSLLHAQATANARATFGAHTTAAAQAAGTARALATQQASIYATATALGQATAQSDQLTATATTLNDRLSQITQGKAAFSDSLSDASGQGAWDQGDPTAGTGCLFSNGSYQASSGRPGFLQPCIARATSFSNFVYQVQMTITRGSQGGLLFRADATSQSYYLFRIGIDGSFALDLYQGSSGRTLLNGYSSAITTGLTQTNMLSVLADQSTLVLYVNEQVVASLSDTSLSAGQIGVVAIDYGLPTVAEFSDASVWTLA
jgi:hypothetical protein